jgi:hypothetical protein
MGMLMRRHYSETTEVEEVAKEEVAETTEVEEVAEKTLNELTLAELKALLEERSIPLPEGKVTKKDLVALLEKGNEEE